MEIRMGDNIIKIATGKYDCIYDIDFDAYKEKHGKKSTTTHINNIFCFDIETANGFRLDDGNVIQFNHDYYNMSDGKPEEYKNPVAMMYVWQAALELGNGEIIGCMGRTWDEFESFLSTLNDAILNFMIFGSAEQPVGEDVDTKNFLQSQYNEKYVLHFYVHNLSFEFQFLRNTNIHFTEVFAREMKKPMRAIAEFPNMRVVFHDTLTLTQKSLAAWGKDSNLPVVKADKIDYLKIITPADDLDEKTINYCMADVVTMVYGVQQYRDKYDNQLHKIPMTQTGEVRLTCREKISNVNRAWAESCYKIDHGYSYEFYYKLVDAFAGGWTHANMKFAGELMNNVICYDFASSYPSVMTSAKFPISKERKIDQQRIEEIEKIDIINRDVLFMVTFEVWNFSSNLWNSFWSSSKVDDCENLQLDNGKIIGGQYAKITMTDLDFDIFKKAYSYERLEVVEAYEFDAGYLPKEMILTILDYFENKSKLKGTGNESLYNESKQFINSIYGCCVMKIITDEIIFKGDWTKRYIEEKEFMEKMAIPDKPAKVEKGISQAFTTYQIGVWVTAWARHRLWDMIFKIDDKLVYADTDSLKGIFDNSDIALFDDYNNQISELQQRVADFYKFDVKRFTALTSKGKVKQLGIFEREDDADEFKTIGAKRYAASHNGEVEITIAGLPKSAGHHHIKNVDELINDITWSPEESGKLMCHYVDNQPQTIWTGESGEYVCNDKFGIMLEPIGFNLSLAAEYDELLEFLSEGKNTDYYSFTSILRH